YYPPGVNDPAAGGTGRRDTLHLAEPDSVEFGISVARVEEANQALHLVGDASLNRFESAIHRSHQRGAPCRSSTSDSPMAQLAKVRASGEQIAEIQYPTEACAEVT